MKNVLLDKGIILPSGEISKDTDPKGIISQGRRNPHTFGR